jgi:hypothetical protein
MKYGGRGTFDKEFKAELPTIGIEAHDKRL